MVLLTTLKLEVNMKTRRAKNERNLSKQSDSRLHATVG